MYVVRLQAKRIQGYLSGSPRLKHMIGASELVERSATDLAESAARRFGGERLGGGAGQAWLRFEGRADAERFLSAWPVLADAFAPGLLFASAAIEYPESDASAQEASLLALESRLRASANLPSEPVVELSPLVERSPATGQGAFRPERRSRPGKRAALLDLATARKEHAAGGAGERLSRDLHTPAELKWPASFDDVAGEDDLAVIHADGNGLGELIRRVVRSGSGDRLASFLEVSELVTRVTLAAARRAAEVLYEAADSATGVIPGRPLVLGGDDLSFVVRARLAGPYLRAFLTGFEEESEAALAEIRPGSRDFLTACAGVALVRRSFPFLQAYELAETACSWAKERARASRLDPEARVPSALVFHRATTSLVGPYPELLETELQGDGCSLAQGPYRVSERAECRLSSLADLDSLAAELQSLPRGAARGVVGELRQDRVEASRRWERALTVAGPEVAERVREAHQRVAGAELREAEHSPLLDALVWRRMSTVEVEVEEVSA